MSAQAFRENHLLRALPAEEYERVAGRAELVRLELSRVIFRPDEKVRHVYFPTTCVISLLTNLQDGAGMEVGLVGREGMAGISAVLGGVETKVATVQAGGEAARLEASALREEFQKGGALQGLLLGYTHALMTQISQSVVCNVRHALAGRLTRWLLMFRDRVDSDQFFLTHEFMANMLGVRRSGVSEVASRLQKMGFIRYQRGHITILDRAGMEEFACECYPAVKEKFQELIQQSAG